MFPKKLSQAMKIVALVFCLTPESWNHATSLSAQEPETVPTIRVQTSLTLVDGVVEEMNSITHDRSLVTNLQKVDYRLFDNGKEVSIKSFDTGTSTRPIALWLIVQCDIGLRPELGSRFILHRSSYLKSALQHLSSRDSVRVAHWCDDGDAKIDTAPGTDIDAALQAVEAAAASTSKFVDSRTGELAMQKLFRMVDQESSRARPPTSRELKKQSEEDKGSLPVFLFLYGDHSATNVDEANAIVSDVLETSGMVFGLSNVDRGKDRRIFGQIYNLVHYYARNTGGEYYSTPRFELFSPTLEYMISQLHLRYTLGFEPANVDGKVHELRVELSREARGQHPRAMLRFRRQYIPVRPRP